MQILNPSPDQLIVKKGGLSTLLYGIFSILIGGIYTGVILATNRDSEQSPFYGIIFIAIGIFSLFRAQWVTLELNKGMRQLTVRIRGLRGSADRAIPWEQIKTIHLTTTERGDTTSYSLKLTYEDNTETDIYIGRNTFLSFRGFKPHFYDSKKYYEQAGIVADFLGLPLQSDFGETVTGVLAKKITEMEQVQQQSKPTPMAAPEAPPPPKPLG